MLDQNVPSPFGGGTFVYPQWPVLWHPRTVRTAGQRTHHGEMAPAGGNASERPGVGWTVTASTTTNPARSAEPRASAAITTARRQDSRWQIVDLVRGVAIVAVVLYHLVWDLGHFGLTEHWVRTDTGRLIGHLIAGTFLFLTGFSLVLAHRSAIDLRAFAHRLLKLIICAYAVTAVSLAVAPRLVVTFGILHAIALTSVLLLPFLGASRLLALGAAAVSFALPQIMSIDSTSRWLTWTGLTPTLSPSLDVQPMLPMFGVALLGLVSARTVLVVDTLHRRICALRFGGRVGRTTACLGRRTLVIYLLHQPVLFGGLLLLDRAGIITTAG